MTQNIDKLKPKYDTKSWYAITIQPNDKLQFHGNEPMARILKSKQHYYTLFQKIHFPYYINMEISEPIGSLNEKATGGRLHYHGLIKFRNNKDITKWLLHTQYFILRQARLEVSKVNDKEGWLAYIEKQKLIPYDIKNLSNYDNESLLQLYLYDDAGKKE